MYPHISNNALLWALGFIRSAPAVAKECAFALVFHKSLLPDSEAIVLLHELAPLERFIQRRLDELRLDHLTTLRTDSAKIIVSYTHDHGVAGFPARHVEREYSLEEARGLLRTLLIATKGSALPVMCNVFGVAPGSPLVEGDVLEALDSGESRSWYGADRNAPRPGEHWVIERPWTHTATMRRIPDGFRRTSQTFILLDKRVWRLIGVVRNVAAIATMGGKDAPALDIVSTEREPT